MPRQFLAQPLLYLSVSTFDEEPKIKGRGFMASRLKLSFILLGLSVVMMGYQNCGQGFQDVQAGSEEAGLVSDISFDDRILTNEKLSTNSRVIPSINSVYEQESLDKKEVSVKIYQGQKLNGSRFTKFNIFLDGKYLKTVWGCGSRSRYCIVKVDYSLLNAGQSYSFQISGIDEAGDWTPQHNSVEFVVPEEEAADEIEAVVAEESSLEESQLTVEENVEEAVLAAANDDQPTVDFKRSGHYKSINPDSGKVRTYIVVQGKMCENASGEIRDPYTTVELSQAQKTAMIRHYFVNNMMFEGAPCR